MTGSSDGQSGTEGGYKPKLSMPAHQELTYFIGGGNGNALIEEVLNDLGWKKLKDKLDDSYTMKWCELKQSINYNTFRAGEQLVNHIPNCNLLTNKLGLLNSLQEYERVCASMKKRVPKLDFIPETFRLEDIKEREALNETWKDGDIWICKPTGRNQGKGIFLVKDRAELDQLIQETEERNQQAINGQKQMNRVIQRYLNKPLLLEKKKFDIRAYMLVASTVPYLVLYHKGYVRLSMFEYENKYDNLAIHLTNQFIQKKDPKYKEVKEDTIWDFDKFNEYVNEHIAPDKALPRDWVHTVLPARMKHIMTYCFNAVKHRLHCKVGFFDLYGFDFMIDENMKVWLIEVNVNPTLATNCASLKSIIPPMVKETIYVAVECFDKSRRGRPLSPVQSLKNFDIIFQSTASFRNSQTGSPGRTNQHANSREHRSQSTSPARRARSLSPAKEVGDGGYSRRNLTFLQPGLKAPPTHMFLYTNRPTNASHNHSSLNRAPTKTNLKRVAPMATNSSLSTTQRSPYISSKMGPSSSSGTAVARSYNLEKSRLVQNQQGPKVLVTSPKNEQMATTNSTENKARMSTPIQGENVKNKSSSASETDTKITKANSSETKEVQIVVENSSEDPASKRKQAAAALKKPDKSKTPVQAQKNTSVTNTTERTTKKTAPLQKNAIGSDEKTPPVLKLILKPPAKSSPGQTPRREVINVLTKQPASTAVTQGPSKPVARSRTMTVDKRPTPAKNTKSENVKNNNNTINTPHGAPKTPKVIYRQTLSDVLGNDTSKGQLKSETRGS